MPVQAFMYGRTRTGSFVPLLVDDDGGLGQSPVPLKWSYVAASGGITDNTAVTAVAAGGSGIVNLMTSIQICNKHASVDTEVVVLDGSTVIWRGFAYHGGTVPIQVVFPEPLTGSPNTAMKVQCVTTGSATYINAQGYQSSSAAIIADLVDDTAEYLFDDDGNPILDDNNAPLAA